jgi:PPP family 3-phenylpropionic acid transporter
VIRRGEGSFAAGYLAYYMAFGVFMPYWSAHLSHLGWTAGSIGVVLAIFNTVRIVSPLVGGWLLDVASERKWVLVIGAILACVCGAWAGAARSSVAIGMSIAIYSLTFTAILPAYDAVVLDRLGADRSHYGRLRLWGSIGFVVMVLGVGALIDRRGDGVIPWALVAGHLLAVMVFLTLPRVGGHSGPRLAVAGGFLHALSDRSTRILLLIAFLQIAGFGAFNGFYTIFLRHYGYSEGWISGLWALGVVSEIVLFWLSPRLLARVSMGRLLGWSVGLTILRWAVMAWLPTSRLWIVLAQVSHAACFGLFQACTVMLAARFAPPGAGGRAQALLSAAGPGLGGIVGSLVAGFLYQAVGPSAAFMGGAAFALLALIGALWPTFLARL